MLSIVVSVPSALFNMADGSTGTLMAFIAGIVVLIFLIAWYSRVDPLVSPIFFHLVDAAIVQPTLIDWTHLA